LFGGEESPAHTPNGHPALFECIKTTISPKSGADGSSKFEKHRREEAWKKKSGFEREPVGTGSRFATNVHPTNRRR